jgi:hypothetical protein
MRYTMRYGRTTMRRLFGAIRVVGQTKRSGLKALHPAKGRAFAGDAFQIVADLNQIGARPPRNLDFHTGSA